VASTENKFEVRIVKKIANRIFNKNLRKSIQSASQVSSLQNTLFILDSSSLWSIFYIYIFLPVDIPEAHLALAPAVVIGVVVVAANRAGKEAVVP
jgi:hypothetical protein